MVFNWFRRQFSQQEDNPPSSTQDPDATPQEQVSEAAPTAEAAPNSNELNLEPETPTAVDKGSSPPAPSEAMSWAKAAFQRIQQRRQQSNATPDSPPPTSPQSTQKQSSPAVKTPSPASSSPASSSPATLSQTEGEPSVAPVEIARPETESQPPAVAPVNPSLSASTPASKTAIPPSVPSSTVSPNPSRPGQTPLEQSSVDAPPPGDEQLQLDEGFLWSAEVLAAQGRRPEEVSMEEITWLQKLRRGLGKTRQGLVNQLKSVVGQGPLNEEGVMEIEALLLQADTGIKATDTIIEALQTKLRQEALPTDAAIASLKQILRDILDQPIQETYSATFAPDKNTLNIWLMTGVNGAGKTTTIGKIAHIAQNSGYSCLIAAADTFRAAAVEQVRIWGERSNVDVIANPGKNTDPAAVVFDAIAAAESRGANLLLVDTAGRLQNKKNLMEELGKVRRIIDKKAPNAKVESLIVLDATLGQNGLRQAEVFSEAAQLTGVVLTKLDGTAKGGIALAVVQQLGLPIRFIGAGEGITDLRPFSSYEFVEALISA